jgi:hypothetical protein
MAAGIPRSPGFKKIAAPCFGYSCTTGMACGMACALPKPTQAIYESTKPTHSYEKQVFQFHNRSQTERPCRIRNFFTATYSISILEMNFKIAQLSRQATDDASCVPSAPSVTHCCTNSCSLDLCHPFHTAPSTSNLDAPSGLLGGTCLLPPLGDKALQALPVLLTLSP